MLNATGMKEAFTNGVLYLYSGPQPANADAAVTGTLLGIVTKNAGAFSFGVSTNGLNLAAPSGGVVAKDADNWQTVGIADGTIGWFRLMGNVNDPLGVSIVLARMDGSVAISGADMNFANISMVIGAPLTIDTFSYTFPAA
jgi:hypothetical protein